MTVTAERGEQVARAYARLLRDIAFTDAGREGGRFHPEALGTCTVTATAIARELRGAVYGYHSDDNPTAELGQLEGGHDFAFIDDRFIVDWWATVYPACEPAHPGILDLHNPRHAAWAARWYGPSERWGRLGLIF